MFRTFLRYRFRVIPACLLALFLSSAPNVSQWPSCDLENSEGGSKQVLFSFVTTGASSALLSMEGRTRHHGFDSLPAVFQGNANADIFGEFSSVRPEAGPDAAKATDLPVIPIRAPPFRKS